MAVTLNKTFKNVERIRILAIRWKLTTVTPVFKKVDRRKVHNYRPKPLPNPMSKFYEQCMYIDFDKHFAEHSASSQHGLSRNVQWSKTC